MASSESKPSSAFKSSYVKTIVLGAILIGSVVGFWIGLRLALRTDYPLLTVASGSMIPTLNVGDLIVVQGILNASQVYAAPAPDGTIIVFRSPRLGGELIVHRAINKAFNSNDALWYFQTRGDNNGVSDFWTGPGTGTGQFAGMISETLLIGHVVGRIPYLGYIPLKIRTTEGILLVIALIIVIVLIEYIPEILKRARYEKPPED